MYNDLAVIFQSPDENALKISFVCCVTRMKVVRLGSSLRRAAPVYVQAERKPPKMSLIVASTFPRYGTSTVLPSEAL